MEVSVVDLFCGIGGLTKGLELAGLNVIAGIDIEEKCKFAYESNNEAKFINQDISNIKTDEVEKLYPENNIKILAGCTPCQPFSKYTKRYRKDGYVDEKWKLLYSFARIVKELKPGIIALENVPGLSKEKVFSDFVELLKDLNYFVEWSVVFCPDYGVPQNRKRLVLLASLFGSIEMIPPLYTPDNYLTVRQVIKDLPPIRAGEQDINDPLHRSCKLSDLNLKRIRQSVAGGTWRDWDESLLADCHKKNSGKTYPSVYGRMKWDEPSPTITTQFYGFGNGRFGHPEQDRAISLREGALLQSFPPDYIFISDEFPFNTKDLGIHIGNAVPVELGKAIGLSIKEHLKEVKYSG